MIQQQYYTRERYGLFRNTEGYDSIAKSKGLDDELIKDSIHRFCFYSPPISLVQKEDTDESCYPKSLISVPLQNGQRMIGCATYKQADFTGLRNTFFMHNYVISEDEILNFLLNPEKIVNIKSFEIDYNIENGKELSELTDINFENNPRCYTEINKKTLCHVISSIFEGINSNKKIYIALDCELEEMTEIAKDWMYVILKSLPIDILKEFGFSTYIKECIDLEGLHLMFLPKKTIKLSESMSKRDIYFDLESGQSVNATENMESEFLNFCVDNFEHLDSFFSFAVFFLQELSLEKRKSLAVYDDIAKLYMTKINLSQNFNKYNKSIFQNLENYINSESMSFYQKLLDHEYNLLTTDDYLSTIDIAKKFVDYHGIKINTHNNVGFVTLFCKKNVNLASELLEYAQGKIIYVKLIKYLLADDDQQAFFSYYEKRMSEIDNAHVFMLELGYWCSVLGSEIEITKEAFYEILGQKLKAVTENTTNPFETARDILNGITEELKESDNFKECCRWMTVYIDAYLLKAIDIKEIDFESMQKIPDSFLVRNNKKAVCEAIFCLNKVYNEINTIAFSPQVQINEINRLSKEASAITKSKIIELLKDKISEDKYSIIAFSFSDEKNEMLDFVKDNCKKELAPFLIWCTRNNILNLEKSNDYTVVAECIRKSISDSSFKSQIYTSSQLKQIAKEVKPSFFEALTRKRK